VKSHWSIALGNPLLAGELARQLALNPLVAQCLLNRGLSDPPTIKSFLQPRLKQLADPFLLPNMSTAVERLLQARQQDEQVVIFGDYDVDGVTSTALLTGVLKPLGWRVGHYLPHRRDEGYGLSQEAVANCLKIHSGTLLLAVDCGSTSVDSIAELRRRGVDVIVLDHHQISEPAPAALAIVNPQLSLKPATSEHSRPAQPAPARGETLPPAMFTELCSAGLAFKLAHALVKRARALGVPGAEKFDLRPLLDLVALGTVADLVPLTGENRILVSTGLERLSTTCRPGLMALKQVARCPAVVGSFEAAFQLAPRLNAAGRLETATDALQLLLTDDRSEAQQLAQALDSRNLERQRLERTIAEEAIGLVQARFKPETDFVIVEGAPSWHIGVVGIVASRVLQRFYRPTLIVGGEGDEWRGSGRSIAGFDLAAALRECDDLLIRHGGHAMAAGLTVRPANLDRLRERLNEVARRCLKPEELQPRLRLDAEVGLEEMNLQSQAQLNLLKPTGQGNPPVQFCARGLTHQRPLQRMGTEKQHVKMWVTDGTTAHEAVWWGAGHESLPVGRFDLAFAPQVNDYNGRQTVQLKVLDWKTSA
jgi:single-stranded-DNA-specific exonuclease